MARAVLTSRQDAGGGLSLVELEPEPSLAATYVRPGQYVKVVTSTGEGYFAFAGEPGEARWAFLVRNNGEASIALVTAPIGTEVDVTSALGDGFDLARAAGRALVVATPGSAIAVTRSILRTRLDAGEGSRTHVFLGARAAHDLPLQGEIAAWVVAGVPLTLCLSRAELHHDEEVAPGARRAAGYVQGAIAAALRDRVVPADAVLFGAGPAAMLAELKQLPLDVVTNA